MYEYLSKENEEVHDPEQGARTIVNVATFFAFYSRGGHT